MFRIPFGDFGSFFIRFRPLAGCRLFPPQVRLHFRKRRVSVPLRGVDCFHGAEILGHFRLDVSVSLRGVDCFFTFYALADEAYVSVPLRGVDCFQ